MVSTSQMQLVVIGATGGIGRELLRQAKERGHRVTALVRSPEKLGALAEGVNVIRGNPLDAEAVKEVIAGQDAVLSALGPPGIGRSTVQQDGARSIVAAMRSQGMRRLLVVSVAMLFEDFGVLTAIVRNTVLRNVAADSAEAERIIKGSGLDWTIVRPPRLTNRPLTRSYSVADGHMPAGSSGLLDRADVAHFLLEEVERRQHVRQIVGIGLTKTAFSHSRQPVRT